MPNIPHMNDFFINIDMNEADDITFKWLKHVYDASVSDIADLEAEKANELASWEAERDIALSANTEAVVADFQYTNQNGLDHEIETKNCLVRVMTILKGPDFENYTPETYTRS